EPSSSCRGPLPSLTPSVAELKCNHETTSCLRGCSRIAFLSPVLDILRRQVRYLPQLLGLASVQALRDRERRVHANHAGVEIELRHAFEAAGRTFLDAHSAAFAVVDQNLVETVRADRARDAGLRADQLT